MRSEDPLPFWIVDGVAPAGATAEEIRTVEEHLGRTLPAQFKTLLREQNGGVSNYIYRTERMYVGLPAFFSLAEIVDAFDNAELYETPEGLLAIGTGGHYWLGLDYRAGPEPAVIYQETEDAEIECVAASFEEFLAGLVEDE